MMDMSEKFRNVSIKTEFANRIEQFIDERPELGYRSIAQFLEDSARRRLETLASEPPRFEQINHDENGVKVFDRQQRQLAEISFKREGVFCGLCENESCEHVAFALRIPDLQAILKKKRKDGWKIPEA
jgi:hypothetical protein